MTIPLTTLSSKITWGVLRRRDIQEVWYVSLNQYLMEHLFSSHSFYALHHLPQQAVSFSKTEVGFSFPWASNLAPLLTVVLTLPAENRLWTVNAGTASSPSKGLLQLHEGSFECWQKYTNWRVEPPFWEEKVNSRNKKRWVYSALLEKVYSL